MAYLRELAKKCTDCHRSAVVELRGRRNEFLNRYCHRHGQQALARQHQIEVQNDADIARNPKLKGVLA